MHGPHNHVCPNPKCCTVWHHDPATIPNDQQAIIDAHSCPKCGRQQYGFTELGAPHKVPQFCSNGRRCIALDGSAHYVACHPTTSYIQTPDGSMDHQFEALRLLAELNRVLGRAA